LGGIPPASAVSGRFGKHLPANMLKSFGRGTNSSWWITAPTEPYVNGKRVTEILLKNGDVITFAEEGGPKVSFLIQTKEGPSRAASIPPNPFFAENPMRNADEGDPAPFPPSRRDHRGSGSSAKSP